MCWEGGFRKEVKCVYCEKLDDTITEIDDDDDENDINYGTIEDIVSDWCIPEFLGVHWETKNGSPEWDGQAECKWLCW